MDEYEEEQFMKSALQRRQTGMSPQMIESIDRLYAGVNRNRTEMYQYDDIMPRSEMVSRNEEN